MKRLIILLLPLLALLQIGCKSGGNFAVYNNCSHPAYAGVGSGELVTIPAHDSHVFYIDTDTQNMFTGAVYNTVPVIMFGETYAMVLKDTPITYTDSTTVKIQAGKTLNAYLNPNRACVKVVNNSTQTIERAEIWKHTSLTHTKVGTIFNLIPGSSVFQRVDYAVPNNQFYYQVEVYLPGVYDPVVIGNENNVLAKDEQFVATYPIPE